MIRGLDNLRELMRRRKDAILCWARKGTRPGWYVMFDDGSTQDVHNSTGRALVARGEFRERWAVNQKKTVG